MAATPITLPGLNEIRAQFPGLKSKTAFLENAGGSQVPLVVADAIRDFMLTRYVNVGATYRESAEATQTVKHALEFVNLLMNGGDQGGVVFGPSTTRLCRMLSDCYAEVLQPGDEVVLAESAHESNYGCWTRLKAQGVVIRNWPVNKQTMSQTIEDLLPLLNSRTKIVAFPHVSNLLGEVMDVRRIADLAHQFGARVVVDGVAFASHGLIDVAEWDADFYVYSCYKVYGPHLAAMWGKHDAWNELQGPNHFFISKDYFPGKFDIGCPSYEAMAGVIAYGEYLKFLAGESTDAPIKRSTMKTAYGRMSELESEPLQHLLGYLNAKPGVTIIGPRNMSATRVGTVSFVSDRCSPPDIVAATDRADVGIRNGHMYAYRLCEALGIDTATGVVRVSLVHYNTIEEVQRCLAAFDTVL